MGINILINSFVGLEFRSSFIFWKRTDDCRISSMKLAAKEFFVYVTKVLEVADFSWADDDMFLKSSPLVCCCTFLRNPRFTKQLIWPDPRRFLFQICNWLLGFHFCPSREGSRLKLKDCHAILRVTLEIIESSKLPFQPSTSARRLAII